MDVHQKKEEMGSVEEMSMVRSQKVFESLYLGRIGRLDISWSVNNFARAITKWTKACDLSHRVRQKNTVITHVNANNINASQQCR